MTLIMNIMVSYFHIMTLIISINLGVQEHDVFFTASRLKIVISKTYISVNIAHMFNMKLNMGIMFSKYTKKMTFLGNVIACKYIRC